MCILLKKYNLSCGVNKANRNRPLYIVTLESGVDVYSNDYGKPPNMPKMWLRLKDYVKESGDNIKGMKIRFRSNTKHLPHSPDGYYFAYGMSRCLFGPESMDCYVCGNIYDNEVQIQWFKVPEIVRIRKTVKSIDKVKQEWIIYGKKSNQEIQV